MFLLLLFFFSIDFLRLFFASDFGALYFFILFFAWIVKESLLNPSNPVRSAFAGVYGKNDILAIAFPARFTLSGFQLEFVFICWVINHMNCYELNALIGRNNSIQT